MKTDCNNLNRGFAALITAIILSLILIVVAIVMSQSGFLSRQILSESENKEKSAALAEACADNAILFTINNPLYAGGPPPIIIDGEQCEIYSVTHTPPIFTIKTRAEVKETVTKLKIIVDDSNFTVESWEEVASF